MDSQPRLRLRLFPTSSTKNNTHFIIVLAAVVLALLPFWTSFQDVLTRWVMSVGWYRSIQNVIVPYELRVISTILSLIGIPLRAGNAYIEWTKSGGSRETIYLAWNCVGWQTLVLFLVTLATGLSGKYRLSSKIEAFLIGILGTYLLNIGRLVLVILVYFAAGRPFGTVFHDYFSNLLTLVWLVVFWWFSFRYVLIEKTPQAETVYS